MTPSSEPAGGGGTWHADTAALAAAVHGPALCALDELGVIAVQGADAAAFLQSQLTNDVLKLALDQVARNGYCTAKGRLLATFDLWRQADAVYLQLPASLLPGVLKRLSMFVLRAKASISDASAHWVTRALLGPGSSAHLARWLPDLPAIGATVVHDGVLITRLEDGTRVSERFVLRYRTTAAATVAARLADVPKQASALWWWSQIDAAVPTVFAATQEKFVPQMINYEVLGGVSFRKGCYPGQEVVARSQYLGKLRRRMSIGHVAATAAAADDVFAAGGDQPIGLVAMAAAAPGGGTDVLFECPVEQADGGALTLGPARQPILLRALPYALLDVTA